MSTAWLLLPGSSWQRHSTEATREARGAKPSKAKVALTRALRARHALPPEVAEKAAYLAALQPRAQRA